jgi:hypothetical protein
MGKYNRGLDYMELEGGRGGGGGAGGRYTSSGKKSFDAEKDALNTLAVGFGAPLAVAGAGIAANRSYKGGDDKQSREAAAEIKRETRGVEKTFNDRAREAQAESTLQNKTNKAAEDASKNMAKGGTASSRADGIAQRGKTKGTMVMCGGGMSKSKK